MQTYSLSCRELGTKTCDHVARGKTESEVKSNMLEHASVAHAEDVNTEAREDALGRRIDDALAAKRAEGRDQEKLDNRANADPADLEDQARVGGYGIEDGSQGGEFLDDGTRNDDREADGRRADRDRDSVHQGARQGAGAPRR